jgi:hypothetical protein
MPVKAQYMRKQQTKQKKKRLLLYCLSTAQYDYKGESERG